MIRQQPISPFSLQQPYSPAGGQMPGPALSAMLGGRTLGGYNPIDAQRQMQKSTRGPQPSLLDMLLRSSA